MTKKADNFDEIEKKQTCSLNILFRLHPIVRIEVTCLRSLVKSFPSRVPSVFTLIRPSMASGSIEKARATTPTLENEGHFHLFCHAKGVWRLSRGMMGWSLAVFLQFSFYLSLAFLPICPSFFLSFFSPHLTVLPFGIARLILPIFFSLKWTPSALLDALPSDIQSSLCEVRNFGHLCELGATGQARVGWGWPKGLLKMEGKRWSTCAWTYHHTLVVKWVICKAFLYPREKKLNLTSSSSYFFEMKKMDRSKKKLKVRRKEKESRGQKNSFS